MSIRDASTIAQNHWETKWVTAEGAFDPAYERTNLALRRWVDGMEAALASGQARSVRRVNGSR